MAVSYESIANASAASDADLTIGKPTGLSVGDIMLALLHRSGDGAGFATLSGWTNISDVDNGSYSTTVLAKIADSGDVAASNFTFSVDSTTGDNSAGSIVRVSGNFAEAITNYIISSEGVDASTGGENAVSYTGLTPIGTASLLIGFISIDDAVNNIAFGGYAVANNNPTWTEIADIEALGIDYGIAYGNYASPSATGNFSATVDQNGSYIGNLISISETEDVTVSPAVVQKTASVQAPTVTAGATVSPAVVQKTAAVQDPTVTTEVAKWKNTDKSDTSPTLTNKNKS